jgi:hypothetical protein
MKKRQTGASRQVAEKPEALDRLSSAYCISEIQK